MAAKESSPQGAQFRKRRAALAMLALLALSICLSLLGAHWFLQNGRARMLRDMGQDMGVQANSKVALLTVWSGTLLDQMDRFVAQDLLRLFATEVSKAHVPAENLLQLAEKTGQDVVPPPEASAEAEEGAAARPAPLDSLAPRLPIMQRQLRDFIEKNGFLRGSLINTDLQVYLSSGAVPKISEEQSAFLRQALQSRRPVFMPVRRQSGDLVMDMAFPVFAPLYVEASGETVTSLLLVSCNVLPLVKAVTRRADGKEFSADILQHFGAVLQRIDPDAPDGFVELPGWALDEGRLPLFMRNDPGLPEGQRQVYSLAQPVPKMPWLVAQGMSGAVADDDYAQLRANVYLACLVLNALTGILLAALWWWLVGRSERAVAAQLRRLYLVVNQQKQIMDGVNSALSAGIVLNDLNGVIYYANQSFAQMSGRSADDLRGLQHTELKRDLARSLVNNTQAVHRTGGLSNSTEALSVGGETRYFLTSCSPFCGEDGRMSGAVSVYNDMTELALAQQRAQQMVNQMVNAFVRSIEAVDLYLRGQSALTAQLALTLAFCMGRTDSETLNTLSTAANLSQLGMIRLPRELLTKSGALSQEERVQMQKHVEYAREALADIDFGLPVLETITQAYERLDGSGYPAGLAGDAICPNARILAVANTFCALMRPRSYRTAHSFEDALNILDQQPPKYDAAVLKALRDFLRTGQGQAFLELLRADSKDDATQA